MIYVSEIMTSQPYTLTADAPISDAIKLMADKHIRHIPIVDGVDELAGIVTHRDLLAATGNKLNKEETLEKSLSDRSISEIMTSHVLTTQENTELISAARFLEKNKFDALPVVKDKKVVGIVTDSDFLAVAINLLEQLAVTESTEEF